MHPESVHRIAPIISAVEREAATWFGAPVDAVTPEEHVERSSSDVWLLRIQTRTRTAGVRVRMWRVGDERSQERHKVEERVRREFQVTMGYWRAFDGVRSAGCVRPLAYFPEHLAIVTEEAFGQPFSTLLERVLLPFASKRDRSLLDRACQGLAIWLRQFQQLGNGEVACEPAALTQYIDARLRRLVASPRSGFTEHDRVRVLLVTAWLVARLQSEGLVDVPIHAELTPEKMVVSDDQLTVLDCTSEKRGLKHHDLASIHMHVGLFASDHRYSASLIREVQRRLLHAFDPELDAQRPAFRVAQLVNVVNHYVTLSAQHTSGVTALYDWRTMRRHRSWLRRLEGATHARVAAR